MSQYMILVLVKVFFLLVMVLLSVSFFTLMEQKVLGEIQFRWGPNETGFQSLIQPIFDALKLFKGELTSGRFLNFFFYFFSPSFMLFVSLLTWICFPLMSGSLFMELGMMFYFCCLGVGAFPPLISGWFSNSKYSFLGSVRVVSQVLSYEVSFLISMISVMFYISCYNMYLFEESQSICWFVYIFFPLPLMWMILSMAETSRTPFDLFEGESELVSGFNTEYSGGTFSLFFIAEYSTILFMCFIFSNMFLGGPNMVMLIVMANIFIMVRGIAPRIRFDSLMLSAWTKFLTVTMGCFLIIFSFKNIYECLMI